MPPARAAPEEKYAKAFSPMESQDVWAVSRHKHPEWKISYRRYFSLFKTMPERAGTQASSFLLCRCFFVQIQSESHNSIHYNHCQYKYARFKKVNKSIFYWKQRPLEAAAYLRGNRNGQFHSGSIKLIFRILFDDSYLILFSVYTVIEPSTIFLYLLTCLKLL